MGTFSIWHWLIVLVVVLLLFGRGKRGMNDDEEDTTKTVEHRADEAVATDKQKASKTS
jgi:sec-independent protein translocase protein TatA